MDTLLTTLAGWLEPWATLHGDSVGLQTGVVFVHLAGLLIGGGGAVAEDLGTLRVARGDPARRGERLNLLGIAHRTVVFGLALSAATGALMLGADFEAMAGSAVFWVKMGLVAALLANGALMMRAETGARSPGPDGARAWRMLTRAAGASALLWFLILFVSVLLRQSA
ncbi:MAG: hypothetical protein KY464_11170 [Gemmatimonadetes bacterium]|nr:hypothetical protein [Gemmatimonadota bacterium]